MLEQADPRLHRGSASPSIAPQAAGLPRRARPVPTAFREAGFGPERGFRPELAARSIRRLFGPASALRPRRGAGGTGPSERRFPSAPRGRFGPTDAEALRRLAEARRE